MNFVTASNSSSEWPWHPYNWIPLSYPEAPTAPEFFPKEIHYGRGGADMVFVAGWAVIFFVVREVLMRGIFAPFIRRWLHYQDSRKAAAKAVKKRPKAVANGSAHASGRSGGEERATLRRRGSAASGTMQQPVAGTSYPKRTTTRDKLREKKITRFAEQGWAFVYPLVYWTFGFYIHSHAPYYPFNLDYLWIGHPQSQRVTPGPVKFYYLTQLAFWFTQIVIINIEERRKDYYEMLSHHLITTALIMISYWQDVTRVGCLILVLLDFCDILLPLAKLLKYMSLEPLPDVVFALFMLSWVVTRQILYSMVVVSAIRDVPRIIQFDDPNTAFSRNAWFACCCLLSSLAVLFLVWAVMIARVAKGAVMGKPVEDERSDDEESDENTS